LWDFFAELPQEIEEPALVVGCTRLGAFFSIAVLLAVPGLTVAFLFAFMLTYHNAATLPFQIVGNVVTRAPRFWDISAQGMLVMLPPMLIAIAGSRYIVRGLILGAVK